MEQAMMTGLTFGTIFAITGSIFLPMIVHAAFDVAAVAIIYWDIEEKIAHLVFK
jgi:membrane protease YdiL (CAAX protease family)